MGKIDLNKVDLSQKPVINHNEVDPFDLEEIEIRYSDNIHKPDYCVHFDIQGAKFSLGTKGNFSVISGKAKSRKSFFIDIVVSTFLNQME